MFEDAWRDLMALLGAIDRADFAFGALAAIVAGAIRGFAGFGAAMVKAPVLALLYGPPVAVALMSIMEIPALPQVLRTALKETTWRRVLPLAIPAMIAIPLGTWVLTHADPELLRRVISATVIVLVAVMASGRMPTLRKRSRNDGIAGFSAGFLGASTGIGGPPLILYFLGTGEAARKVRGDLFGFFFISSVTGLISFTAYGLITPETLSIGLLLAPPYMLGLWFGSRIFPLASEQVFRRVALSMLAVIGAATLLK
jgi:hypothetical protein